MTKELEIRRLKYQLASYEETHHDRLRQLENELYTYEQVIRAKIRSLEDDIEVENINKEHSNNITIHFNNLDSANDVHAFCDKLLKELKIKSFKVN